jgi:tRNA nucleotidyltransferase/poly(A) polymerase
MKLKDVFDTINVTAKEVGSSTPYIVGGMVRDIMLGNIDKIKDVDLTCGDKTSNQLGQALVTKFDGAKYTTFNDGHGRLSFERFDIDFSNNFNVPNIESILAKQNIKSTSIEKEMFSRDFTVNALLMPLDLSKVYDLTKKGINDLNNKKIDTCLDPNITLLNDPKRISRIVYLCAKLDFRPTERVVAWVRSNKDILKDVDKKYTSDKINKALSKNEKVAIEIITELGINDYLPQTSDTRDALSENPELLLKVLNEKG